MRRAPGGIVAVALVAAGVAAGCGGNHAAPTARPADAAPPAGDTARGVVAVTGAEPITRVTLRTAAGALTLEGPVADTLRRARGLDVWVAGTRTEGERLEPHRFRVRSVDGVAAADGVLELDGDAAVLVAADGTRVRYGPAPAALRRLAGHRVWIAGAPGREPQAWGSLEPGSG